MDGPWRQCSDPTLHDPHTWDYHDPDTGALTTGYCAGLDGTEATRA